MTARASRLRVTLSTFRTHYLEGHGDLVSGLMIGILGLTMRVIGVINLLTKSP